MLLNCYDAEGRWPSVVPAERRGGEAATRALLAAGASADRLHLGRVVDGRLGPAARGLRARAARRRADRRSGAWWRRGDFLPSGGHAATHRLLDRTRPDAIFCANDLMAVGCYEALKERGERVGETIGVMGYDDQEIAQQPEPRRCPPCSCRIARWGNGRRAGSSGPTPRAKGKRRCAWNARPSCDSRISGAEGGLGRAGLQFSRSSRRSAPRDKAARSPACASTST